jgi:hypothetical protein
MGRLFAANPQGNKELNVAGDAMARGIEGCPVLFRILFDQGSSKVTAGFAR